MSAPYYSDDLVTIFHGDCLDVLPTLPDASVDAVVCDPPYALSFMGKSWDSFDGKRYGEWCEVWAAECLRVLKPGGHLLAFGGTRTYHRLACAVEDAGFEIRDSIAWLYGSGFPKSLNVGEGRGTALKPAHEPIVVGRKSLAGTVAANVLTHGTGALNIDACRTATTDSLGGGQTSGSVKFAHEGWNRPWMDDPEVVARVAADARAAVAHAEALGRWPANVLLDDSQAEALDAQTGETVSRIGQPRGATAGDGWGMTATGAEYADAGGASRFFPVFEGASTCSEGDSGTGITGRSGGSQSAAGSSTNALAERGISEFPTFHYEAKAGSAERPTANGVLHPTVKPLDLMRWLVRLVTPPGGVVLDPFEGSGTTAEACVIEGFGHIGIEREADYLPLIVARLAKPIECVLDFGVTA